MVVAVADDDDDDNDNDDDDDDAIQGVITAIPLYREPLSQLVIW